MIAPVLCLLTSIAALGEAPLVVRGEVVARRGDWTTVVLDRVLVGAPGAGAVTYAGGPPLPLGARVVLPLERRGSGFRVPEGAAPVRVHTTREIEDVEDAVLARQARASPARAIALACALLAGAALLGAGIRRALPASRSPWYPRRTG